MVDKNQNMIPDFADKIIAALIAVTAAVLGVLSQMLVPSPVWIPIVLGGLGGLSGLFDVGIWEIPARWKKLAGGLLGVAAMVFGTIQIASPTIWIPIVLACLTAVGGALSIGVLKRPARS